MNQTFQFFETAIYDKWQTDAEKSTGLYGIIKTIFKGRLINIYNQNFIDKCVIETEYNEV